MGPVGGDLVAMVALVPANVNYMGLHECPDYAMG